MSSEYYSIQIEIPDVGIVNAWLLRSAAPLTVKHVWTLIQDNKFITGRARWVDAAKNDAIYFEIGIHKGKEGKPGKLRPRDIGYSFKMDSVIIYVGDQPIPYDAVKIGEIKENFDILKNVKNGMSMKLKLVR